MEIGHITFDGRDPSATYAGLRLIDVWRGKLHDIECTRNTFGLMTMGCIYLEFENVHCHANTYGGNALQIFESYFAPLIGPANIHIHTRCNL